MKKISAAKIGEGIGATLGVAAAIKLSKRFGMGSLISGIVIGICGAMVGNTIDILTEKEKPIEVIEVDFTNEETGD